MQNTLRIRQHNEPRPSRYHARPHQRTHTHANESFSRISRRFTTDGLAEPSYLASRESNYHKRNSLLGQSISIAEMIGGTTCFNDHYFFPEATEKEAMHAGIRACLGLQILMYQHSGLKTKTKPSTKHWISFIVVFSNTTESLGASPTRTLLSQQHNSQ